MNSVTSIIFNGADRLKTCFKKVLPQRFLTGVKIKMLDHGYKSLAKRENSHLHLTENQTGSILLVWLRHRWD